VRIERNGQWLKGEWVEGEPKTKAGKRTLSLPPSVLAALRTQRAQQAAWRLQKGQDWQDAGLVFTNPSGRPLPLITTEHALQRACERLGLPPLTPHGLRHCHASLLLGAGLSLPAVSARLGHANPSVTMSVYAHVVGGEDKRAAEVISKVLQGQAV
jgi:integrase